METAMSAQTIPYLSPPQYLEIERKALDKSEYFSGQMFAMAGASREHNLIVGNIVGEMRERLKGKSCETYPSDLRVLVSATGLYTYPNATVACGEPEFADSHMDILLNPLVIVEVLSASTENYDRGAKFAQYQRIESLREYVLVSQDKPRVERYTRQADGGQWLYEKSDGLKASVTLNALSFFLPLSEIYARVSFPREELGTTTAGEHQR